MIRALLYEYPFLVHFWNTTYRRDEQSGLLEGIDAIVGVLRLGPDRLGDGRGWIRIFSYCWEDCAG